jgi:hypothetical protein
VESFTTWHRVLLSAKINTISRTVTLTFNYIADKKNLIFFGREIYTDFPKEKNKKCTNVTNNTQFDKKVKQSHYRP